METLFYIHTAILCLHIACYHKQESFKMKQIHAEINVAPEA